MRRLIRSLALAILVVGMLVSLATGSLAKRQGDPPGQADCKPGWGYGDRQHRHCGPPGQAPDGPGQAPKGGPAR